MKRFSKYKSTVANLEVKIYISSDSGGIFSLANAVQAAQTKAIKNAICLAALD